MKGKNKKIESKIKVDHNFNEVVEGVDYIMTIKDQNVLDENDNDIDILENEVLNIKKKMKLSEKLILDKEQDKYLKDQILSKYDENKQEGFIIKTSDNSRKGITKAYENILGLNENINEKENDYKNNNNNNDDYENENVNENEDKKKNEINSIKEKLRELKAKNNTTINKIELLVEKKFQSDYLKPEEFKPKEIKKIKFTKKIQLKSFDDNNNYNDNENNNNNNNIKSIEKNNNNIFNKEIDDYNELENFLERQRNLINKEKLKNTDEEKLKIVNNSNSNKYNQEKENENENKNGTENNKEKNKGKNFF
jgi:hypothetical protein